MSKKTKRGDFIHEIKTYDINEGTILDKRKIKGSETDWAEFLKKFGIPFIENDKKPRKSKNTRVAGKRKVCDSKLEDSYLQNTGNILLFIG